MHIIELEGGAFMLFIQKISLDWDKNERGAKGENVRRQFPFAYPVGEYPLGEVVVQNLNFYQQGTDIMDFVQAEYYFAEKNLPKIGFTKEQAKTEAEKRILHMKKYQYQSYSSIDALNLTNLSICPKADTFDIIFFYDEQRSGAPFRSGHNRDFLNPDSRLYQKDNLNETAFVLRENQYGRIVWNERRVDYDFGTWYYQLHIYNLFYVNRQISKDIFVRTEPDFVYQQIAKLY